MADQLTVTDGNTTEQCDVTDTYEYYGTEVAKVSGDTINGFVVVK